MSLRSCLFGGLVVTGLVAGSAMAQPEGDWTADLVVEHAALSRTALDDWSGAGLQMGYRNAGAPAGSVRRTSSCRPVCRTGLRAVSLRWRWAAHSVAIFARMSICASPGPDPPGGLLKGPAGPIWT